MPTTIETTPGTPSVIKKCETRDFYQASYLVAKGYRLERSYARGSDQMMVFLDVASADVLAYINGDAVMNARTLFDATKALRTLLQTSRDSQGLKTGAPIFPASA